jgi:serine/threonine-protein kinase PknG
LTGCNRPACAGTVDEYGYCDTCLELAEFPQDQQETLQLSRALNAATSWWGEGLIDLPGVSVPDPGSAVIPDPSIPEEQRFCHRCKAEIGRGHHGQPALPEGTCYRCAEPYSYLPRLRTGELLDGRYEIAGCIGHGGVGWVYLAWDRNLDGRPVVVKGLIDTDDPARAEAVINERKFLIQVTHPNIVSILNFVEHPPGAGDHRGYHGYIVMEYVGGHTLQRAIERGGMPLSHAIAYCLQILKAIAFMHGQGLGFGDLSLGNVMVAGQNVKLIDLGAVTAIGSPARSYTKGFAPVSELRDSGVTAHSDLYALGRILDRLFRASADHPWPPLSPVDPAMSLHRFINRCVDPDPKRRFVSAAEAAGQLSGVLHEIVAWREDTANAAPALLFSSASRLLDDGLGAVPKLDRWLTSRAQRAAADGTCLPLPDGVPSPRSAAADLPAPRVDPVDAGAGFVVQLGDDAPTVVLDRLADFKTASAEAEFARCRAYLRLGQPDQARGCLGVAAAAGWRLIWHQGLLALAEGRLEDAQRNFDLVYHALPGEAAPKLALAVCAEHLADVSTAGHLYETVWRMDRSEVSAAFGLARVKLRAGQRDAAIKVLDEVRPQSRQYDAARIAIVRISAGQLATASTDGTPDETNVAYAARRLHELRIAGHVPVALLQAEVWEAALALLRRVGPGSLPGPEVLGAEPTASGLRSALERAFREFASWAPDSRQHAILVDLANKVRPRTLR